MSVARWIIPAYAGSTTSPAQRLRAETNHPRIRGEHEDIDERYLEMTGSSPHTRGAPLAQIDPRQVGRIIPAYAGSTASPPSMTAVRRDHPRIRGEHGAGRIRCLSIVGSSPHTRGAPDRGSVVGQLVGIIPAYAGSTRPGRCRPVRRQDHPRIRGEHGLLGHAHLSAQGSSPHTRGAPERRRWQDGRRRIIPAYAGSTKKPNPSQPARGDHPRIRGEHGGPADGLHAGPGSSPHTRGARLIVPAAYTGLRIIPAYAGSTPTWTG